MPNVNNSKENAGIQRILIDHIDSGQKILNAIPNEQYDEQVASYDTAFAKSSVYGVGIYGDMETMPAIIQAAHERRMELLDSLPIGDVSNKICVDYGVGSWGFAGIFPKLHPCRLAIGIEISLEAIRLSEKVSAGGGFAYGDRYFYLTSRGDDIRLANNSVDVVFTGECIEYVENTAAFLDEIHRILKPGGLLILTTPNADAYLYKIQGERYAVGPEHVALMGYDELLSYVTPRFDLLIARGFNGSFYRSLDEKITDKTFAKTWARNFEDHPELAGVIIMAQRKDDYRAKKYSQTFYHYTSSEIEYQGPWRVVSLHSKMTGAMAINDKASLSLKFSGSGVIINFWTHDWSGYASVSIDGVEREAVNLYHPVGGFIRTTISGLNPDNEHVLTIKKRSDIDPRSHSNELIVYQIATYGFGGSVC